jgi:acetyltransferase-like isoleucine patch superfamily enzyme
VSKRNFTIWKLPKIEHGKPTIYGWTIWKPQKFFLGENTDIGWGCFIQAEHGVEIGSNTQIGGGTYVYSKDTQRNKRGKVVIGKNVRIGAHCLILPGVEIPDGAKIPAKSIVK